MFLWITLQKFFSDLYVNAMKAGNHKSFLGMKVKTWNSETFTANNKQYILYLYICSYKHIIWYSIPKQRAN